MTFLARRPRLASALAWSICLFSAASGVSATVLNVVIGDYGESYSAINKFSVGSAAMGVTMTFVGALIASRRPENLVGWLLLLIGFTQGFDSFLTAYAIFALYERSGSLPLGSEMAWMVGWDFAPGITALLIFLPLLFPTGKLLSPRWRIVAWLGALQLFLFVVPLAITSWQYRGPEILNEDVPEGAGLAAQIAAGLQGFSLLLVISLAIVSVVSVVKRYRRADGHERLQLKWFTYAVAAQVVVSVVMLVLPEKNLAAIVLGVLWSTLIPLGVGIAVLRHRLYGIDVIINRTLVYLPLTGILAGLYVVLTSVSKTLFTDLTDSGSELSVAISTLAVVAVLTPLKNHLQSLVDRHFKARPDPLATVRRLATQARSVAEVLDTQRFITNLLTELKTGIGATGVRLEPLDGPPIDVGEPDSLPPLELTLTYEEDRLGRLLIWQPAESRDAQSEATDELTEAAAALAQVLSISRLPTAGPPAASMLAQ
jgi:hypothetical protein